MRIEGDVTDPDEVIELKPDHRCGCAMYQLSNASRYVAKIS
jgi:hypothetical protein